jgi:hypothetical protein
VITTPRNDGEIQGWSTAENFNGSVVKINILHTAFKDGQVGDILLHSSETTCTSTDTLWTSPVDGLFEVSRRAWDADFADGRNARWELYINSTIIASNGSIFDISRNDASAIFVNNIALG